jgi:hypothetical protein
MATPALAFDFVSPTAVSAGKGIQLSSPGPGDLLNLPIGAQERNWWRVETGLSRSYDLRDLDLVFAAGARRIRSVTFALGYSQFGHSDLYSEKLLKGSISIQRNGLAFGVSGSYMSLGFGGGYTSLNAAAFGLAAGWHSPKWHVAGSVDDLNSTSFADSDPAREPRCALHGEFASGRSYALLGHVSLQKDQDTQFGVGQRIIVKQTSALLWGFTTAPFTFGGGMELGLGSSRITYSANYHSTLGLTQLISISYGSTVGQKRLDDGLE